MNNANFPGFDGDDEPKKPTAKPAAKPAAPPAAPAFEFEESEPKPKKPAPKPAAAGNVNPFADQPVQVNPFAGQAVQAPGTVAEPPKAQPGTGRTARPGAGKPAGAKAPAPAPASDPADQDIMPGTAKDLWLCPHCGAKNKPSRETCRECDKSPDDEVEIPWFKKPAILAGIGGAVVVLIIIFSMMGGADVTLHPAGPGHIDSAPRIAKGGGADIDLGDSHKFTPKKAIAVSGRVIQAAEQPTGTWLTAVVLGLGGTISDDAVFEGAKAEFKDTWVVSGAPRYVTLFCLFESKPGLKRGDYLSLSGIAGVAEQDAIIVPGTVGSDCYTVKVTEFDKR
jgi:hypothetical protein